LRDSMYYSIIQRANISARPTLQIEVSTTLLHDLLWKELGR